MMLPELSELKKRRKSTGLTQAGLAAKTSVSQSMIAKIEAGAIVPSYANAKRLFDFFDSLAMESQARASDFMTSKVISTSPNSTLREAARAMRKNGVSQLPVLEAGKAVGTVSEKDVLARLSGAEDIREVSGIRVEGIMGEAMPTAGEDTPFRAISALLEHNPGVLVTRAGRITGIITKSDLLGAVLKKNI